MPQQLAGKIAVITGGTQGLGETTARLFAERGAAGLVICGRNRERGQAVADDLSRGDFRRGTPRFDGDNFSRNLEVVERVRTIATEKGVTPGQLALAWVQAQADDVVPIPGTKRRTYLEENVAALDVQLSPDDLAELEAVASTSAVAGERTADMSWVAGTTPSQTASN